MVAVRDGTPKGAFVSGIILFISASTILIVGLFKNAEERFHYFLGSGIIFGLGLLLFLIGYFLWFKPYLARKKFFKEHPELKHLDKNDF